MMKTMLSLAIALFFAIASNAQDFSKYESLEGVTSIKVNKAMFKLMSKLNIEVDDKETQEMINMIQNIEGIQVLTTADPTHQKSLASDAKKFISSNKLDELMRVNEGNKTVEFYIRDKPNSSLVEQLFMHVNDEGESVLIFIKGNIDMSKIGALVNQFNLPGGNELQRVN